MLGNGNNTVKNSQSSCRTGTGIPNPKVRLFFALLCVLVAVLVWWGDAFSIVSSSKYRHRVICLSKNSFVDKCVQLNHGKLNVTNTLSLHRLSPDFTRAILIGNSSKTVGVTEEPIENSGGKDWATKSLPSDNVSIQKQRWDPKLPHSVNITENNKKVEESAGQGNTSGKPHVGTYTYLVSKAIATPSDHMLCNSSLDPSYMYGRCITGTNHMLLYNRVPKCGSRTFLSLAEALAPKNGFHKPKKAAIGRTSVQTERKKALRKRLTNMPLGSLLHGHINFIDFSNDRRLSGKKRPIYFNIIRDPIDRLVSQYYFVRYGDRKFTSKLRLRKLQKDKFLNETFNDCVERERSECYGSTISQLNFFCGYHPDCRDPEEAFRRAVRNLDHYLVVGVTEEYEDFLKVLEKLLPDYFKGIVDEYHTPAEKIAELKTSAKKKQSPTEAVRDKMLAHLDVEYKFYHHVKSKFEKLKQKLGIG